jgi:hypothetical protein
VRRTEISRCAAPHTSLYKILFAAAGSQKQNQSTLAQRDRLLSGYVFIQNCLISTPNSHKLYCSADAGLQPALAESCIEATLNFQKESRSVENRCKRRLQTGVSRSIA